MFVFLFLFLFFSFFFFFFCGRKSSFKLTYLIGWNTNPAAQPTFNQSQPPSHGRIERKLLLLQGPEPQATFSGRTSRGKHSTCSRVRTSLTAHRCEGGPDRALLEGVPSPAIIAAGTKHDLRFYPFLGQCQNIILETRRFVSPKRAAIWTRSGLNGVGGWEERLKSATHSLAVTVQGGNSYPSPCNLLKLLIPFFFFFSPGNFGLWCDVSVL